MFNENYLIYELMPGQNSAHGLFTFEFNFTVLSVSKIIDVIADLFAK